MQNIIQKTLNEFNQVVPNLEYLKLIKTGKEAGVHLVKSRSQLFAMKIYKENNKYSSKFEYMPIEGINDSRLQRAVKNRSRIGQNRMKGIWTSREFKILKELGLYSNNVPKVYGHTDNAILMEYFGDESNPAPRLKDVELTYSESRLAFQIIKDHIKLFIDMGFVHGDLSEYNILWFNNTPYIIDFPQILDIKNNRNSTEKFMKDIDNIGSYFQKNLGNSIFKELDEVQDYYFINLN